MSCPVCFGGDDPVMRESLNAGIGVLLGVTGVVLACFARFFVALARRAHFAPEVEVGLESFAISSSDTSMNQAFTNHRDTETRS